MAYIELGYILKTHGLKGDLKIYSTTDFPDLRFKRGTKMVLMSKDKNITNVTVNRFIDTAQCSIVHFKEINSIEEASKHLHETIQIDEIDAPLPAGYYRNGDLLGCNVFDENGNQLGIVSKVETNAPTSNLRIARENNKDFFVPFVFDTFIVSVDIKNKKIVIKLMEGMF